MAQLFASLSVLTLGCLIMTDVGKSLMPSPCPIPTPSPLSRNFSDFSLRSRSDPLRRVIVFYLAIALLEARHVKPKGKMRPNGS